jgi:DNA-directed RNA polymerase subunit beta
VKPEAPVVGTGVEGRSARDSGQLIVAKEDGVVSSLSAKEIRIRDTEGNEHIYPLRNFFRSNASTCINQKPIVDIHQEVKKGDVIADGPAMDHGELALGQNILVAFLPWEGGNYEDAILLSERLVRNDMYTSIHIEDYAIDVRDTKLGPEVVTRDIPNVSEEKLKDLDEEGVIRIGAEVSSGERT